MLGSMQVWFHILELNIGMVNKMMEVGLIHTSVNGVIKEWLKRHVLQCNDVVHQIHQTWERVGE